MITEEKIKCDNHPDEEVSLTCGGCGKQICAICMTLTGEGVRCQACMARLNAKYYKRGEQAASPNNSTPNWTRPVEQIVIPAAPVPTSKEPPQTESSNPQLIEINPVTGEASTDITFCRRHPKIETGLRCARCNTPICPRCMVYTSVGLRCPDCANNPQPTVKPSPGAYAQANAARGVKTGPRNYWRRNANPAFLIEPQHYFMAIVVALGAGLLGGLIWGFLLDAQRAALRGPTTGFINSIHLVPEILIGVLVGGAISRATRNRRGIGLQWIGVGGVFFGYFVAIATMIARVAGLRGSDFPPLNELLDVSWRTFTNLFLAGNSSQGVTIILFLIVGAAFAWMRLKR